MRKLALAGLVLATLALAAVAAIVRGPSPERATAASHREAPLISLDPAADNTDTYFFRSYEPGKEDKVVLIMNVLPGEEPSAGPNYYNFDPNVRYSFNIDNDQDGRANDVVVSFDFRNEIRGVVDALGLPLAYVGNLGPVPPITALDGPGSEGLGLRQRYSVSIERADKPRGQKQVAGDLIAVPSNVGPKTMPDYDALTAQGVYDLGHGIKVYAGQRNDPFAIDLGATFDTLNFRRFPPLLTAAEDLNDSVNPFGFDQLSGFSVHTIAIELPASMLTADGKDPETTATPKLGLYASTERPVVTVRGGMRRAAQPPSPNAHGVQVSRLANPLVNELIIGTKDKDEWNALDPDDEERFSGYYLKPRAALALQLAFGFPTGCTPFGTAACSPNPPAASDTTLGNFNRDDLVNILLKYSPADTNLSELLRLDVSVDPVPLAAQKRLAILAGDAAGWPNGRRPKDDVVDIAIRVVGGPLYIGARAGDGVNTDLSPLPTSFPFVARPSDGRNLDPEPHVDPAP